MGNFGYVKAKEKITPEVVNKCLDQLNKRIFKTRLSIEKDGTKGWAVSYIFKDEKYAYRYCWIKRGKFHLNHGGGYGDFGWWLGTSIINEVAFETDGVISDDGSDGKWKGEKGHYDSFEKVFKRMHDFVYKESKTLYEQIWQLTLRQIPKDY